MKLLRRLLVALLFVLFAVPPTVAAADDEAEAPKVRPKRTRGKPARAPKGRGTQARSTKPRSTKARGSKARARAKAPKRGRNSGVKTRSQHKGPFYELGDKGGVNVLLKKPQGASEQDWKGKVDAMNEQTARGKGRVTKKIERGGQVQREFRKRAKLGKKDDADHALDLWAGGKDKMKNMRATEKGVNRSVGAQGKQVLQDLPEGTKLDAIKTDR